MFMYDDDSKLDVVGDGSKVDVNAANAAASAIKQVLDILTSFQLIGCICM